MVHTATLLAFLQLVHGPAAAFLAGESLRVSSTGSAMTYAALGANVATKSQREVHILRGAGGSFFGHFALATMGLVPRWRILSQTPHVLLLRKDEHSFELIAAAADGLFPEGPTNLFRDTDHRLQVGEIFEVPGMRVEVLQLGPHGPTRARYTFDEPLESSDYAWVDERADGLRAVPIPRAGFGRPYDP
jgi:hypothetical protein